MHTTVSISEAKAKLSAFLKRAQRGETFSVTHRGAKMAEITPPIEVQLRKRREAVDKMRKRWQAGRAKNPRPRKFIPRSELHEGHKY
jgi:prevent-host-death family protein